MKASAGSGFMINNTVEEALSRSIGFSLDAY
jgi:hypothetical protein